MLLAGEAVPIPTFPVSPSTTSLFEPTLKSSPASVPKVTPIITLFFLFHFPDQRLECQALGEVVVRWYQ